MNTYPVLAKQHYNTAFQAVSQFAKLYTSTDKFAYDILLISFDLTLQLSVLELKALDFDISFDEIRYLLNISNSARIFEFLYLTFGLEISLNQLATLTQNDFADSVKQIATVLSNHTTVFLDAVKQSGKIFEVNQLKNSLCNLLSTFLHVEFPSQSDCQFVSQTTILRAM